MVNLGAFNANLYLSTRIVGHIVQDKDNNMMSKIAAGKEASGRTASNDAFKINATDANSNLGEPAKESLEVATGIDQPHLNKKATKRKIPATDTKNLKKVSIVLESWQRWTGTPRYVPARKERTVVPVTYP